MLPTLEAVPTRDPAPRQACAECDAYNAVFEELGLDWRWDEAELQRLRSITDEKARVRAYLTSHHPHLLRAYDLDCLADAIVDAKARRVA